MESLQLSDMGKTTSLGIFQFSQVDSVITKWIVEGQLCAHSVDGRVWPLKWNGLNRMQLSIRKAANFDWVVFGLYLAGATTVLKSCSKNWFPWLGRPVDLSWRLPLLRPGSTPEQRSFV